jgi:SAM-dependent methyltransferase
MEKRAVRRRFDKRFYDRYYPRRASAVSTARGVERLSAFVLAYLEFLGIPVRSVLDVGCGVGLWGRALGKHTRRISYVGIDSSEYLSRRYGWVCGSIVDYAPRRKFDLIVCQDVLQYLDDQSARAAIDNMAWLCRGGLYVYVPTAEDFRNGALDMANTDTRIHARGARWYRRRLDAHFRSVGGGVFISGNSPSVLLELEKM